MELPRYCIMGIRPVKLVATADGGMDVLAYQWDTGEFKRDMSYLTRAIIGDGETDFVSESEFEAQVAALRAKLAQKQR